MQNERVGFTTTWSVRLGEAYLVVTSQSLPDGCLFNGNYKIESRHRQESLSAA